MSFAYGVGVLLLLILLALPLGVALGMAGVISLYFTIPVGSIMALTSKVVHSTTASTLLMTIPMFVLMSEFLASSGVAQDLLLSCNRAMRKLRGGLAMACILAGTVHAAATGSSTASAASLARASFPAMTKAGYAPSFSVGTIATAGTLAIMVPPSVAFILFGIMTETSIGRLFLAGVIPGLLTCVGYMITISITLWLKPSLGPSKEQEAEAANFTVEEGRGSLWPMLALITVVLGGLYTGVATPTEIAALGALGAFLIALYGRRMNTRRFADAVGGTMRISSMIIIIVFGAHIFGYFISFSRITDTLLTWIGQSGLPPTAVMLGVVFLYLIMGMIMDQAAILILTAPISTALMVGLGYDPIWWGVVIIKTAEIGMITPPLGLVTFVTSSATGTDLKESFKGVMPFALGELVILSLLLLFPSLSLWLAYMQ